MNQLFFIAIEDYTFILYPIGTQFSRISGIYAFFILPPAIAYPGKITDNTQSTVAERRVCPARPAGGRQAGSRSTVAEPVKGPCHLLYIGITNNFHARFKQHHKIPAAMELGLTHIGILKVSSGRKRKKIERQLLQSCNPPLNQTWLLDNPKPLKKY